MSSKRKVKTV